MRPTGIDQGGGKDLRDLSRTPLVAFPRKQGVPTQPRAQPPKAFQELKVFLPTNLWQWIGDYLRYRVGRKHSFAFYTHPERDYGVYPLQGDAGAPGAPIRMALAGDWGTGTDEAFRIAELITAFKPHYSIHLGDVYFVGDPNEDRAPVGGGPHLLNEITKGRAAAPRPRTPPPARGPASAQPPRRTGVPRW